VGVTAQSFSNLKTAIEVTVNGFQISGTLGKYAIYSVTGTENLKLHNGKVLTIYALRRGVQHFWSFYIIGTYQEPF